MTNITSYFGRANSISLPRAVHNGRPVNPLHGQEWLRILRIRAPGSRSEVSAHTPAPMPTDGKLHHSVARRLDKGSQSLWEQELGSWGIRLRALPQSASWGFFPVPGWGQHPPRQSIARIWGDVLRPNSPLSRRGTLGGGVSASNRAQLVVEIMLTAILGTPRRGMDPWPGGEVSVRRRRAASGEIHGTPEGPPRHGSYRGAAGRHNRLPRRDVGATRGWP